MATFGLLGEEYPLSSSDDSDAEPSSDKQGNQNEANKKIEENIPNTAAGHSKSKPKVKSRWNHVVQEYDDSSYIRHFISQSDSSSLLPDSVGSSNQNEDTDIHQHHISSEHGSSTVLSREQCAQGLIAALNQQKQLTQKFDNESEHDDDVNRLAEIYQIQQEIQVDRQNWENVYSDEESKTVELVANKRTNKKKKKTFNNICQAKDGSHYTKGERWKRLKLMSETRVKNNPEKYSSIPKHKFPLRP